jgi:hypothetical protein
MLKLFVYRARVMYDFKKHGKKKRPQYRVTLAHRICCHRISVLFWGMLKDNMCRNMTHTLEKLKTKSGLCTSNVAAETLRWFA